MSTRNQKPTAVILVDPVSSGRFLKAYVPKLGHKLIGIFTVTDDQLKKAGKHLPQSEKVEHCDAVIYGHKLDEILYQLTKLPYQVVAVVAASEPGVELADLLTSHLGLKGNSVSSSLARRDKYETRLAIQAAGLSGPEFAACKKREEAIEFANTHTLPVVVKTPKGAGAHHVFVCHSTEEVGSAFDQVMGECNIFGDSTTFALVESFLSGQQYAIELFGDGKTLYLISIWRLDFTKNSLGKSIFEKMATVIDPNELEELTPLRDYALAVGQAVGAQWGPCLVELRNDPVRGPSLIEVGARLSGIDMPVLIKESTNFDPFEATIRVSLPLGKFAIEPIHYLKQASLVFFPVDGHGTVENIYGMEEITQLPSYVMNHLYIAPGDYIRASNDLATIPLYVYLAHEDKAQLKMDMTKIKELFRIGFRPLAVSLPTPHLETTL